MRFVIALFLPFHIFITIDRPVAGVLCLLLQFTLVGWLPAALWALFSTGAYESERHLERAVRAHDPWG